MEIPFEAVANRITEYLENGPEEVSDNEALTDDDLEMIKEDLIKIIDTFKKQLG